MGAGVVLKNGAAGQGFEPRLPGPEPGVLPLDDPAKMIYTNLKEHPG